MNRQRCFVCEDLIGLQGDGCLACKIQNESSFDGYMHYATNLPRHIFAQANQTSYLTVNSPSLASVNELRANSSPVYIPFSETFEYSSSPAMRSLLPSNNATNVFSEQPAVSSPFGFESQNNSLLRLNSLELPYAEPWPTDLSDLRPVTRTKWRRNDGSIPARFQFPESILLGATVIGGDNFDRKRVYYADSYSDELISKSTEEMVGIAYTTQTKRPWLEDDVLVAYKNGNIFLWRPVLSPLGIGPSASANPAREFRKILQQWQIVEVPRFEYCPLKDENHPGTCFVTEIADIGFDPYGNLYCSEISTDPQKPGGWIYRLEPANTIPGDKLVPTLFAAFQPPSLNTAPRWSGNFAFGPDGTLYLSSGSKYSGAGEIYKTNIKAQSSAQMLVRYGVLLREPDQKPILGFCVQDKFVLFYGTGETTLRTIFTNTQINPWEHGVPSLIVHHEALTHPQISIQISNVDALRSEKFVRHAPLDAGGTISLAIKSGTVYQTGKGIGISPNNPVYQFSALSSLQNVKAVATGGSDFFATNLALTADGAVYVWGFYTGLVGNPGRSILPVRVASLDQANIREVHCGTNFCLALSFDGTLYFWGSNRFGLVGDGKSGGDVLFPVPITPYRDIQAVSAGDSHILILRADGGVYGWGLRSALGRPEDTNQSGIARNYDLIPQQVVAHELGSGPKNEPPKDIVALAAGVDGSLLLDVHGRVFQWGSTEYPIPTIVGTSVFKENVIAIDRKYHNLALTKSGKLFGWWRNDFGEMGAVAHPPYFGPLPTVGPIKITLIAEDVNYMSAGFRYSLYWKKDGTLWGAGLNTDGQLGIPLHESKSVRHPTTNLIFYYVHPWKNIPL